MELLLRRQPSGATCTIGELSINGAFYCHTLEDPVRPDGIKIPGATAFPAGRFQVVMSMSHRFKKLMIEVLNVPGFTGVRVHAGVTAKDTLGCVLVGSWSAAAPEQLQHSAAVRDDLQLRLVVPLFRGEEIWLTVEPAKDIALRA
jgi:hypothetical protein